MPIFPGRSSARRCPCPAGSCEQRGGEEAQRHGLPLSKECPLADVCLEQKAEFTEVKMLRSLGTQTISYGLIAICRFLWLLHPILPRGPAPHVLARPTEDRLLLAVLGPPSPALGPLRGSCKASPVHCQGLTRSSTGHATLQQGLCVRPGLAPTTSPGLTVLSLSPMTHSPGPFPPGFKVNPCLTVPQGPAHACAEKIPEAILFKQSWEFL